MTAPTSWRWRVLDVWHALVGYPSCHIHREVDVLERSVSLDLSIRVLYCRRCGKSWPLFPFS